MDDDPLAPFRWHPEPELIGIRDDSQRTTVTGVEMFRKLLDQGQAGENVGLLLSWGAAWGLGSRPTRRGCARPGDERG